MQVMRAVGDAILRAFRRGAAAVARDKPLAPTRSGLSSSVAPTNNVILKFRPGTAAHHEALQRIESSCGATQSSPPSKRPRRSQQVGATTQRRSALQDILVRASARGDSSPPHTSSGSSRNREEGDNSSSGSVSGAQALLQHWDRFSFERSSLNQGQGRSVEPAKRGSTTTQPTSSSSSSRSAAESSSSVQQLFQTWENPVNSRQASSVLQLFSSANPLQTAHAKLTKDMLKTAIVVGMALPPLPASCQCD